MQEAVSVGMHSAIKPDDNIITAYRCHPFAVLRGGTIKAVIAELLGAYSLSSHRSIIEFKSTGRVDGMSHGKGGSMLVAHSSAVAHYITDILDYRHMFTPTFVRPLYGEEYD